MPLHTCRFFGNIDSRYRYQHGRAEYVLADIGHPKGKLAPRDPVVLMPGLHLRKGRRGLVQPVVLIFWTGNTDILQI